MNATVQASELAAEWHDVRALYPLYVALAREFVIEAPVCVQLEAGSELPPADNMQPVRQWFATMDLRILVHQLRQFLQTTTLADDESLRILLLRYLRKQPRTPADRDKIDFLLVQFFSHIVPSRLEEADCDLDYVAQVLEPVLGTVELKVPDWLEPLEQMLHSAQRCHRLSELFNSHVLEQGRKLKVESGESYFQPVAMVAFTRFSFLVRRIFFRLMHDDLNTILDGLRELESRGVTTLDCRRAHFSHQESTDRLRMICHSWKVMFHAEYSAGQPLKMLADLRTVIEEALARKAGKASAGARSAAASAAGPAQSEASAKFNTGQADVPEFEVATGNPAHDDGDAV